MPEEQKVSAGDFAALVGVPAALVDEAVREGLGGYDFRYRPLTGLERDRAVLQAVRSLTEGNLEKAGAGRQERWEKGWQENLDALRERGFDAAQLQPKYFRYDTFRYGGDYIRAASSTFEQDFYTVARRVIFKKYLASVARVIEFGCGTGTSILLMLEMFPALSVIGCDWARPSQEIMSIIAQQTRREVQGRRFDMFHPGDVDRLRGPEKTAVVTLHALEQLGTCWEPMLACLLELRPQVCIHLEPIAELYEADNLFDYLALQYHLKRNYLNGFLTRLRTLEAEGRVSLLDVRRLRFGSFFQEGYSLVVWRPRD